jgi:PAS domain S-box-containing protein
MTANTSRPSEAAVPQDGGDAAAEPAVVRVAHDPINILIVDDEAKNLTVLETVLDDPGYRLVRAESADQALLALVAKEFALLILDIRMPGMTGFELAHLIRQRKKTEQVPIIFLTAYYNEDQHVLEGYGTGAVDYLHKPVNPIILRSKVGIFADLHRKTRALEITNRILSAEVTERREAQTQLRQLNATLEERVRLRTEALIERTRAEEAQAERLRATEEFNRSLMEQTPDCVFVLDTAGAILHINRPGISHMEVEDPTRVEGTPWWTLWPAASYPDLRDAVSSASAGHVTTATAPRHNSDGKRKWWNVSVSPMRDSVNGEIVRVLAVARDVTEAREIEQALREGDQQKDNFIATLAHELRNPLAPIRNVVTLLRSKDLADPQLTWARDLIDRQVTQMTRLLEDLLDVSRITRSKLALHRELLDVRVVVEHALEIARPALEEGRQTIEAHLPDMPPKVRGDLTRLAQVLSNLLINAAKYTPADGRITLTVHGEANEVVVTVSDTGTGIAPEYLDRVFDMFSQIPSAKEHRHGGLGIGLALARGLIEMHGGKINAFSDGLGKGSRFVVRLPVAIADAGRAPAVEKPDDSTGAEPQCRVLVVDDLHDSADSLAMVLRSAGHEVTVAYGGVEAVELAEKHHPQVIFIDLGMPGVDGFEVCRRIRATSWGSRAILIAQTGWGQAFDRRRTQAVGFDQHMVKPLEWEQVSEVLHRVAREQK